MEAWMEALRIIVIVLLAEWGLIHITSTFLLVPNALKNDLKTYYLNIYSRVADGNVEGKEDYDKASFPRYANRILLQHALNLGWLGVWSCCICYFALFPTINRYAWMLFLPVHLGDWGYFIAVDLLELTGLLPEAQTYINSIAGILIAILVYASYDDCGVVELVVTVALTSIQLLSAIVNKLRYLNGYQPNRPGTLTSVYEASNA